MAMWSSSATVPNTISATKAYLFPTAPCRTGKRRYRSTVQLKHPPQPHRRRHTQCRLQLPQRRYRPLCRNRQQTVRRVSRQHRLIGQTAKLGPSSQNPRRSQSSDDPVGTKPSSAAKTVANGSGNVVSMAPMKVFQTDTAFPEAPDGWLVLSMEHSGSRDTATPIPLPPYPPNSPSVPNAPPPRPISPAHCPHG